MTLPRHGAPKARGGRLVGAPPAVIDAAREGVSVEAGQALDGLAVTVSPGAARVEGKVVGAEGRARLGEVEVYLVPVEQGEVENVLRYARAAPAADGSFALGNIAPGSYRLVVRAARAAKDGADRPPAFWDAAGREGLVSEARASGHELKLAECQRAMQVTLKAPVR